MTTTQPDGVNIAADSTEHQRNLQHRINMFIVELERLKGVITQNSVDYMALLSDFEAEKEARTNAQNRADALAANISAMHVKITECRTLLQRVLDAGCTGDVYAQLIDEIRIAIAAEVQS